MTTLFVDANVFLRFFTIDDDGQHKRATELFQSAAAGKVKLVTGPPVLFEIAWTLRSAYSLSRNQVVDVLAAIVALPCLTLTDASLAEEAIELARSSSQEFADAYIAAAAARAGATEIATFNQKHFEKLGAKIHRF
jgi:predicted nucleic acid-binding protein